MDVMISGRHYTTSEISWLGQYDHHIWFRNILQYQMDQVPPKAKSWEFWSAG